MAVRHLELGHDDATAGRTGLGADVGVVRVEAGEGVGVEPQFADGPRGEDEQEPVDRVDIHDAARAEVDDAARLCDPAGLLRRVPPRQTIPAATADDADDGDGVVGKHRAHLRAEAGVEDLGVLVQEHEGFEVVAVADRIEDLVVRLEDRAGGLGLDEDGVGLRGGAQARGGDGGELLGVGDAGGEGDHPRVDRRAAARVEHLHTRVRGLPGIGEGQDLAFRTLPRTGDPLPWYVVFARPPRLQ
ncbi:hypothetical protein LRS13_04415 [Svornostia abyssi]|uniref:Uncharacterized protein n=1 Tax=Svornostia abyssi TaxID=2898438 RepID=A0ABY5PP25_9ACTN|nr:hypothetical protein LRS13_04415 [Parviterribacteraceae bacterium J379]